MLTVSIVTPLHDEARFLDECIASVACQTREPLEHVILVSETNAHWQLAASKSVTAVAVDGGQAPSAASGIGLCSGDIIGWLDSDSIYASNEVLERVVARFQAEDRPDIVYGRGTYIDPHGEFVQHAACNSDPASLGRHLHYEIGILRPTAFIRSDVFNVIEPPRDDLRFAMDYDLWIRAARAGLRFAFLPELLASSRMDPDHDHSFEERELAYQEVLDVSAEHFGATHVRWARRLAAHRLGQPPRTLDQDIEQRDAAVDAETKRILATRNYPWTCRNTLSRCATVEPYRETVDFMSAHGLSRDHHARQLDDTEPHARHTKYTVDQTDWGFDKHWVHAQLERTRVRLATLSAARRSDTCVIAGNGPSLNSTDMSLLDDTDVFVSNFAHLKEDLFQRATYLSVVNNLVAEQGAAVFNRTQSLTKFAPWWLSYALAPDDQMVFLPSVGYPEFSTDPNANVSWRHTVSFFSMQLAYGLGYRRVALIGFDHSYRQSAEYAEGETIDQPDDDENHFDANYFKHKQWHAADVDNMEAMYRLADDAFRADGREITNCTAGGQLELFPRLELSQYL